MTQDSKQKLREDISKILVKWSMPTRQVAILEIVRLFESSLSTLERQVREEMIKILKEKYTEGYNEVEISYEDLDSILSLPQQTQPISDTNLKTNLKTEEETLKPGSRTYKQTLATVKKIEKEL